MSNEPQTPVLPKSGPTALFSALTGLTSLAVLLQGVWAGIFLEHDGDRDKAGTWIDVHNVGGVVALVLAVISLVVCATRLRARKDLVVGSAALVVLLAVEYMLGMLIHNSGKDVLTAIHVPLALVIMAVVVWLPLRVRYARG